MESRPEIAKYISAEARVASIGIAAGQERAVSGVDPVAAHETAEAFLESGDGDLDALFLSPDTITPEVLSNAPSRLKTRGVVVVPCEVAPGERLLESPQVARLVVALSEAGYSILTPPRWLDRADGPLLVVAARHDGYTIRSYRTGDERQILDLFETSFLHRRAVEHWRWEYEQNPHGTRAISVAFDRDEQLVAQYAGYPVPLWSADPAIDGLSAHQIGDTMTAVKIRNVGRGNTSLVVRTAKHFFASQCAGKIAFNYGFNTANIRKMSYSFIEVHPVEPVPFRRAEISALRPASRVSRMGKILLNAYTVSRPASVSAELDRFFQRVAPSYGLLVRRDARYLTWRYLDSPVWNYEIVTLRSAGRLVGWSAFRRRDEVLIWGDALFAPSHAAGAALVLRHAIASPIGRGASHVECWFPDRPEFWSRELDEIGLTTSREPNDLYFGCTPFLLEDAPERLHRDFYYTAFDSDLY